MCPCIKFQLISKTLDFGIKFGQNSGKLNIKFVISMQQCEVNFSQFGKLQIWDQLCPKKYDQKKFEKINIKIVINI